MIEPLPFIGRKDELNAIKEWINDGRTLYFIFINADGGIGKTRLIEEIHGNYLDDGSKEFIIADIIDFDDSIYRVPQNMTRKIAEMLDEKVDEKVFEPYLTAKQDYRDLQGSGRATLKML